MPFAMKIQPIDSDVGGEGTTRLELVKPVAKSRLKRLFERQLFSGVLRNSAAEKIAGEEAHPGGKDGIGNGCADLEPSSVCLAKMVQNFMEENHEKHSFSARCSRNRCNCFNGNSDDSSDAESNGFGESNHHSSGEALEILKGLVACSSVCERNLLADSAKIIEKNKIICKKKDTVCREFVTESLLALGYDASVCKSRWEKSPFYPAGEYEYVDVIIGEERLLIDIDFRSEFEIARSTKAYKAILQTLPYIFVGKCDRLQSIVTIVSEAAKQSLKKKGMHVPPWRKVEYVKAKWLSPHIRTTATTGLSSQGIIKEDPQKEKNNHIILMGRNNRDEFQLSRDESGESKVVIQVKPPELKPKNSLSALAVVLNEN